MATNAKVTSGRKQMIQSVMGFTPKKKKKSGTLSSTQDAVLRAQPRTQQTTRGKRRLTFEQAYNRRTNDSSRARVLKLYGRTEPPNTNRSFPGSVSPDRVGKPLTPFPSGKRKRDLGRKKNRTGGVQAP